MKTNPHIKVFSTTLIWWWLTVVVADPQTNLLNSGCSQYNVSNESAFYASLNATFTNLRAELNNNSNSRFATAQQVTGSAYAMVQCRNYLSTADCLACFTAAVTKIRNCSAANGARVIYDGCFLRYVQPSSTLSLYHKINKLLTYITNSNPNFENYNDGLYKETNKSNAI
jgi:hypothetical protein